MHRQQQYKQQPRNEQQQQPAPVGQKENSLPPPPAATAVTPGKKGRHVLAAVTPQKPFTPLKRSNRCSTNSHCQLFTANDNIQHVFSSCCIHLLYRTPGRGGSLGTPNATLFTPRAAKTPKPTETVGHESDEEETTEAGGAGTALEYFSPMPSAHTTPAKVCKYISCEIRTTLCLIRCVIYFRIRFACHVLYVIK